MRTVQLVGPRFYKQAAVETAKSHTQQRWIAGTWKKKAHESKSPGVFILLLLRAHF